MDALFSLLVIIQGPVASGNSMLDSLHTLDVIVDPMSIISRGYIKERVLHSKVIHPIDGAREASA
jgi:hypothetical protein